MKNLILALIFASSFAFSDDIVIGEYTKHFHSAYRAKNDKSCDFTYANPCKEFKSFQPLIGYSTDHYTVFAMRNSYEQFSVGAVRNFKYDLASNITAFIAIGAASGYQKYTTNFHGITLASYYGLELHNNKAGITLTCSDTFCGLGLKFKI